MYPAAEGWGAIEMNGGGLRASPPRETVFEAPAQPLTQAARCGFITHAYIPAHKETYTKHSQRPLKYL